MHSIETAQLAVVMSHRADALLYLQQRDRSIADCVGTVEDYWVASHTRLELWHQTMKRLKMASQSSLPSAVRIWWDAHRAVLEEILVTELLTRVVAALGQALDAHSGRDEVSPITHAIFLSHMEARNRVQEAMLDRRGCAVHDAVRLNRLRRVTERWSDHLVGRLAADDRSLVTFGCDRHRTEIVANEHEQGHDSRVQGVVEGLETGSLATSLRPILSRRSALPMANAEVASSVIRWLAPASFAGQGIPASLARLRLQWDHVDGETHGETQWTGSCQPDEETSQSMLNDAAFALWFR
ncbi:MAG: hypothetical protein AAGD07_13750 [Planctomycetota bacterium]